MLQPAVQLSPVYAIAFAPWIIHRVHLTEPIAFRVQQVQMLVPRGSHRRHSGVAIGQNAELGPVRFLLQQNLDLIGKVHPRRAVRRVYILDRQGQLNGTGPIVFDSRVVSGCFFWVGRGGEGSTPIPDAWPFLAPTRCCRTAALASRCGGSLQLPRRLEAHRQRRQSRGRGTGHALSHRPSSAVPRTCRHRLDHRHASARQPTLRFKTWNGTPPGATRPVLGMCHG